MLGEHHTVRNGVRAFVCVHVCVNEQMRPSFTYRYVYGVAVGIHIKIDCNSKRFMAMGLHDTKTTRSCSKNYAGNGKIHFSCVPQNIFRNIIHKTNPQHLWFFPLLFLQKIHE